MLQENLKFKSANMAIVDGLFYSFDYDLRKLMEVSGDGKLKGLYSIVGDFNTEINYVIYDGFYFWTLEDYVGYEDYGVIIKKWQIPTDYFCELVETKKFTAVSTKTLGYVLNETFNTDDFTDRWTVTKGGFEEVDSRLVAITTYSWNKMMTSFFYIFDFILEFDYIAVSRNGSLHIGFLDYSFNSSIQRIEWTIDYDTHTKAVTHHFYIDGVVIPIVSAINMNQGTPNYIKIERTYFKINCWFNGALVFSVNENVKVRLDRLQIDCRPGDYNTAGTASFDSLKLFASQGTHRYKSKTFALEHYNTVFKTTAAQGSSYVTLEESYDWVVESGDKFVLGPNEDGMSEIITVSGYIGDGVYGHPFYTLHEYAKGDPIVINKHIWFFNNYAAVIDEGALYKCDANTSEVIEYYTDNQYKNVLSCAFNKITEIQQLDDPYCLLYTSGQTIKFLDIYDVSNVYCSMLIDNYSGSEIFDIETINIYNGDIYRLQSKIYHFGTVFDFKYSTGHEFLPKYSFQRSPLRNFIETLAFGADPIILPNTGVNRSKLLCLVKDQYSFPVSGSLVTFSDNSATGYVTFPEFNTNTRGEGITYYVSGIEIDTITITVKITQVDYIEYVI